eukprot:jgi/Bigna1/135439/aug1.29_g10147
MEEKGKENGEAAVVKDRRDEDTNQALFNAIQRKDETIQKLQNDFDKVVERLAEKSLLCERLAGELEATRRSLRNYTSTNIVSKLKGALIEPASVRGNSKTKTSQSGMASPMLPPPPPPPKSPIPPSPSSSPSASQAATISPSDQKEVSSISTQVLIKETPISEDKSTGADTQDLKENLQQPNSNLTNIESGRLQTSRHRMRRSSLPPRSPPFSPQASEIAAITLKAKEDARINRDKLEKDSLVIQLRREEAALRRLVAEKEAERETIAAKAGKLSRDLETVTTRFTSVSAEIFDVKSKAEEEKSIWERDTKRFQAKMALLQEELQESKVLTEDLKKQLQSAATEREEARQREQEIVEQMKKQKNGDVGQTAEYQRKWQEEKCRADDLGRKLKQCEEKYREEIQAIADSMELLKLESKIGAKKSVRMVAELKKGLQESETSKELLKVNMAQLRISYEQACLKLNSLRARKPPASLPPPPPAAGRDEATNSSPEHNKSGQHLLQHNANHATRGNTRSLSFSAGWNSKKMMGVGSPDWQEVKTSDPVNTRNRRKSAGFRGRPPSLSLMAPGGALLSSHTPISTPTPSLPSSPSASLSKPPPPRWSKEAESEYFLDAGKKLQDAVEVSFSLKKNNKHLKDRIQELVQKLSEKERLIASFNSPKIAEKMRRLGDMESENLLLRESLKNMAIEVRELSDKVNLYKNGIYGSNGIGVEVKGEQEQSRGFFQSSFSQPDQMNMSKIQGQTLPVHTSKTSGADDAREGGSPLSSTECVETEATQFTEIEV